MTMQYRVSFSSKMDAKHAQSTVMSIFKLIDSTYNKYNPISEISLINQLKSHVKVPISKPLYSFFQQIKAQVQLSNHLFDPTVESIQKIWKEHLLLNTIPSIQTLKKAQESVGWHHLHFTEKEIWKDSPSTQIDLGGIAKGLAIDLIVEKLVEEGFFDLYVEWGGEIRTNGQHPEGRPWRVFISNFEDVNIENALAIIDLHNESIATSGDYLQKWTVEGVTYTHIIHPKHLRPLIVTHNSIASTTVIAPTCATADFLATTLMLFDTIEEAGIWIRNVQKSIPSLKFWIIDRSLSTDFG